jgi:hypothetical protein
VDIVVLSTFNITELPYEASITSLRSSALYQLPAEIKFPLFRPVYAVALAKEYRSPQRQFPFNAAFGGLMAAPVSRHWKVNYLTL